MSAAIKELPITPALKGGTGRDRKLSDRALLSRPAQFFALYFCCEKSEYKIDCKYKKLYIQEF